MIRVLQPSMRILLWVIGANVVFALLALGAAVAPPPHFLQTVSGYFDSGALTEEDWPEQDYRHSANQYNDCVVLEMISGVGLPKDDLLDKAFIPEIFYGNDDSFNFCRELNKISKGSNNYLTLNRDGYGRYWHGYVPLTTLLLWIGGIWFARIALFGFVLSSIGLFAVRTWRFGGAVRHLGVHMTWCALALWALPYYGQGFSHAPGDALVFLGPFLFLGFARRDCGAANRHVFVALCGALVTYLDFLTGSLPTAASVMLVTLGLMPLKDDDRLIDIVLKCSSFLAAFAVGAVATVAFKQIIVLILGGGEALRSLLDHLVLYSGNSQNTGIFQSRFVVPFIKLFKSASVLFYNYNYAGHILTAIVLLNWLVALALAAVVKRKSSAAILLVNALGTLIVVTWVVVLPVHTKLHAPFMIRIFMPVIAFSATVMTSHLYMLAQRWQPKGWAFRQPFTTS